MIKNEVLSYLHMDFLSYAIKSWKSCISIQKTLRDEFKLVDLSVDDFGKKQRKDLLFMKDVLIREVLRQQI